MFSPILIAGGTTTMANRPFFPRATMIAQNLVTKLLLIFYTGKTAESEGYVVDVYENYIVLRGRNFVEGKFYPLANYIINTK